jgi:hypothetical protein
MSWDAIGDPTVFVSCEHPSLSRRDVELPPLGVLVEQLRGSRVHERPWLHVNRCGRWGR